MKEKTGAVTGEMINRADIHPVFPSILTTEFFELHGKLDAFARQRISFIHLDIMDGHFVPNLSFGPSAAKAIKNHFPFRIDAHLMVSNPGSAIPGFLRAGADWISFHVETEEDIADNIALIKNEHRGAGLVLNPNTPASAVFPYLESIDYVLLMSVFPGFGGQKFISETTEKTAELKRAIQRTGRQVLIQIDGGVNASNIPELRQAGADLFVIGSFLYNAPDTEATLKNIINHINGV